MKFPIAVVLLLIVPYSSFTQDIPSSPAYGKITIDELTMTKCSFDSSASYMILILKGEAKVNPYVTNGLVFTKRVRIKVFKKGAIAEVSSVSLKVERSSNPNVKAVVYNLVDGVVKESVLQKEGIFEEHVGKYTDKITFTLPNVIEGSVVEYEYTIKQGEPAVPSWSFQEEAPVQWSEYILELTANFLNTNLRGPFQPTFHETKQSGKYERWVMTNLPAFKTEPLMPDKYAFLSSIYFWNFKSNWHDIYTRMLAREDFSQAVQKYPFLDKVVTDLIGTVNDPMLRIQKIVEYLKANVEWTKENDFLAAELNLIMKRKKGTAGDINILLASMLRKSGIKVDLVLLSTRENGIALAELPSLGQFDYVVCRAKIDNTVLLLDATEPLLPYHIIPERCVNYFGFAINEKDAGWIDIIAPAKHKKILSGEFKITSDETLEGKLVTIYDGYTAYDVRIGCKKSTKESWLEKNGKKDFWEVSKSDIINLDDIAKPLTVTHDIIVKNHVTSANDHIYISPFILPHADENPFKSLERSYPIDFAVPIDRRHLITFIIPEGYEVESLPPNKVLTLEGNGGRYSYGLSVSENKITLVSNLLINQTFFQPEVYPKLREFYTRIIAKQDEQIVLKKIK